MGMEIRVVRGKWVKNDDGIWTHAPDLISFNYSLTISERCNYSGLVNEVREKLDLWPTDDLELTYQWPHWMLGPDWRKASPIMIVDDEDTALFLAIRADLIEVFLRARVIPVASERNVNSYRPSRDFSVITGLDGSRGFTLARLLNFPTEVYNTENRVGGNSGGVTPASTIGEKEIEIRSTDIRTMVPGIQTTPAQGENQGALDKGNDKVCDGGLPALPPQFMSDNHTPLGAINSGKGQCDIELFGRMQGMVTELSQSRVIEKAMTYVNNEEDGNLQGLRQVDKGKGKPSDVGVQPLPQQEMPKMAPPRPVFSLRMGDQVGTGEGSSRANDNVIGCGPSLPPQSPMTELRRDLPELFRYFHGNAGIIDRSPIGYTPPAVMREGDKGVRDRRTYDPCDLGLRLTLAGSYVDDMDVNPTQPAVVTLDSSEDSYKSVFSIPTNYASSDDDMMDGGDEWAGQQLTLLDMSVLPCRYSKYVENNLRNMVGGETFLKDLLCYLADDDVVPSSDNPVGELRLIGRKGKTIGTFEGRVVGEVGGCSTNPVGIDNQLAPIAEARVIPAMHERDAPPYFDDPIEEDALDRALHDVDYEGDDIFVGRLFKNKEDCRMKLAIHAINQKFHFRYARSCPNIIIVVCVGDGCPWRVYVTRMEGSPRYEVRSASLRHTCSVDARGNFHRQASTAVIGNMMRARYNNGGRGPRANELRRMLRQEFSLHVSYWKAWRAREIAMDSALGSAMGSYALIPPYFTQLLKTNPTSIVGLETEKDKLGVERFKYMFFSLDACAKGYQYMRKVIVIDGTHLRGRYGGCLVAASAQDGNFQIYPLGFGIVNNENNEVWTWFLEKLSAIVPDDPELVFVSDRHASIYTAIRKVDSLASYHYTTEFRKLAYAGIIMPVHDMDKLAPAATDVAGGKLAPPAVRRPPGRPKKKRFLSRGEFKRVSRRKCTRCRGGGHNRSTCKGPIMDT